MIYVGDIVWAQWWSIGMSHSEPHYGWATVTAVHPSPRVRPDGAKWDVPCTWSDITPAPPE